MVPQKVQIIRFDDLGHPQEGVTVNKPTLALVYENNGYYSDVLINNQIWSVQTEKLNKGVLDVSKVN